MSRGLRADVALVERGLAESRNQAQRFIGAGEVWIGDRRVAKASDPVTSGDMARLEIRRANAGYVGRGAEKIEPALAAAGWSLDGARCLDVGASTGGFTERLLAAGAAEVWAVDVGHGQLHPRLRDDPRVRCLERTNFRHWDADVDGGGFDYAVMDVSFISLRLLLPPLRRALRPGGGAIVLVKPQFELGKGRIGRGGVVRDDDEIAEAVTMVREAAVAAGFAVRAEVAAGVVGRQGNREVFLLLAAPA